MQLQKSPSVELAQLAQSRLPCIFADWPQGLKTRRKREKKMKKINVSKSLMIPVAILALAFTAIIIINQAHAGWSSRSTCFNRRSAGDMGRQMGSRNATRLVNAAWSRLGRTCDQVDRLAQIISETPLSKPAGKGEFAGCFYLGYTDAIWAELENIYNRCGTHCFNSGAEIGRISAEGYCAASLALGGLYDPGFIAQPPLPFCGQNLVFGCKSEYVQVATFEFPGCSIFTENSFMDVFDNSVRQDCFVPEDVPIRDGSMFLF